MAALVRHVRRIALDDDEVRHVEQRKEEACRYGHNARLPLFSHEITFLLHVTNVGFRELRRADGGQFANAQRRVAFLD